MSKSVVIIGTRGYPSYYGGFETAVRKLAPFLADAGWKVVVYGRKQSTRDDDPQRDYRIHTIVTPGLEMKSVSTLSHGFTAVVHALWMKPDVALVMNVANGYFLPLLKIRGIPTLVNVDGIEWDRAKWGLIAKQIFHLGARITARYAERLVFDAREIGAHWKREFGRGGVFIPYGGEVPTQLVSEAEFARRGYVLFVARFVPENTVAEFFDAIDMLDPSIPVVVVGSSGFGGPLERRARSLSETRANFQWLGHVSDDARLMSLWTNAGLYFHGHSVGGTNPALVQAMAAGAPVLARDTKYNREVLGSHGRFVGLSSREIASAIESMFRDSELLDRCSKSNQERAKAHYSWEVVCTAYLTALEELAFPHLAKEISNLE